MINSKQIACPNCKNYGVITIYDTGTLRCGTCGEHYNEDEALDLTKNEAVKSVDSFGETDNV